MIYPNTERGKKVAELLYYSFINKGILGRKDMPEDLQPEGVSWSKILMSLFSVFCPSKLYDFLSLNLILS